MCKKVDNQLKKRTEILIGHRLIVLEDSYVFSDRQFLPETLSKTCTDTETNASSSSSKNKDDDSDMGGLDGCRRDKKNVVKNIVKAFECWLKTTAEDQDNAAYADCRKVLLKMMNKIKFNNQLINGILANSALNSTFEEFLKAEASSWLNNSKIKDRLSHQETIELYLRSCPSGKLEKGSAGI